MKVTRPRDLAALLDAHGLRPARTLGQNFLVDENILRIIVEAAELAPGDAVLEIGPGPGALTEALVAGASRVVAIEKDRGLAALLRERMGGESKLTLIEADALDVDLAALVRDGCRKMVSNLPYASGTRILVNLLHGEPAPEHLVVTLQTDVAERLLAAPGSGAYGLLAIWAQRLYTIELRKKISGSCFFPPPEVQSAVVVLRLRPEPLATVRDKAHFIELTRVCFAQRRKQIQGILNRLPETLGGVGGEAAAFCTGLGIDPAARPEALGVVAWAILSNALALNRGSLGLKEP